MESNKIKKKGRPARPLDPQTPVSERLAGFIDIEKIGEYARKLQINQSQLRRNLEGNPDPNLKLLAEILKVVRFGAEHEAGYIVTGNVGTISVEYEVDFSDGSTKRLDVNGVNFPHGCAAWRVGGTGIPPLARTDDLLIIEHDLKIDYGQLGLCSILDSQPFNKGSKPIGLLVRVILGDPEDPDRFLLRDPLGHDTDILVGRENVRIARIHAIVHNHDFQYDEIIKTDPDALALGGKPATGYLAEGELLSTSQRELIQIHEKVIAKAVDDPEWAKREYERILARLSDGAADDE